MSLHRLMFFAFIISFVFVNSYRMRVHGKNTLALFIALNLCRHTYCYDRFCSRVYPISFNSLILNKWCVRKNDDYKNWEKKRGQKKEPKQSMEFLREKRLMNRDTTQRTFTYSIFRACSARVAFLWNRSVVYVEMNSTQLNIVSLVFTTTTQNFFPVCIIHVVSLSQNG